MHLQVSNEDGVKLLSCGLLVRSTSPCTANLLTPMVFIQGASIDSLDVGHTFYNGRRGQERQAKHQKKKGMNVGCCQAFDENYNPNTENLIKIDGLDN